MYCIQYVSWLTTTTPDNHCFWCGRFMRYSHGRKFAATRDHVLSKHTQRLVPTSGKEKNNNLIVRACYQCNQSRGRISQCCYVIIHYLTGKWQIFPRYRNKNIINSIERMLRRSTRRLYNEVDLYFFRFVTETKLEGHFRSVCL